MTMRLKAIGGVPIRRYFRDQDELMQYATDLVMAIARARDEAEESGELNMNVEAAVEGPWLMAEIPSPLMEAILTEDGVDEETEMPLTFYYSGFVNTIKPAELEKYRAGLAAMFPNIDFLETEPYDL